MFCIKTRLYLELELPPDKAPSLPTITYDEILCIVFQFLEVLLGQWTTSNPTLTYSDFSLKTTTAEKNNLEVSWLSSRMSFRAGIFSPCYVFHLFCISSISFFLFRSKKKKLFVQKSWLASIRINVNDTREVD